MSFFRRIGTVRHKYKVEFFIKRVTFNKVLGGTVYVSLHRGDHKAKSEEVSFNEKTCQFNNQVLTVPTTLFYDEGEHLYQEKPGELRVILKTSNEDKKLLGVVPFDLAQYANEAATKTFKEKKELEQTPAHLKAHITFQVYIEHIGEGSENSKSLAKDEKTPREESPLNKITSFFGSLIGSTEQHENQSPKNQPPSQNPTKSDQAIKKAPSSSPSRKRDIRPEQPEQQILSNIKKTKQPPQEEELQEEALFSRRKPQEKSKRQKRKETKKKPAEEGSEGQQDKQQALFSGKRQKQQPSVDQERDRSNKQLEQPQKGQTGSINNFYFDEPTSFPKKNKQKLREGGDDQKGPQLGEFDRPQAEPVRKEKIEETPKRSKKVKQTSITLAPKAMHETSGKDNRRNRILDNEPTRVIVSEKRGKQENQMQLVQQTQSQQVALWLQEKKALQQTQRQLEQQQMEKAKQIATLKKELTSKDKMITELKAQTASFQELTTQVAHTDRSLKLTQQSINALEAQKRNLETEVATLQAQQNVSKGLIEKLQAQNTALKAENQRLKTEGIQNESFFRQTEERYQAANKDSDLEEEVKRLQREKNEYMLALQKEKQKSKKEAKRLSQEAEKEALNFKQFQEFSKAELKKLKDEALAKGAEAEGWRDKAKEKAKQLETLLRENKTLNGSNIELKEKLASLKIKICEKLNEANERGAFDLMEVLTDLNQEF